MPPSKPQITFVPSVKNFFASRSSSILTILSGPNNSGKSYLLKLLCNERPDSALFFGCNRFFSVRTLSTSGIDDNYMKALAENFKKEHFGPDNRGNKESNSHSLEQILRYLNNSQRSSLFSLVKSLLGLDVSLKHTTHDNDLTPHYVDVDGESLEYTSTGTRLLLTLLGTCFDDRFSHLFLDEPELGLSPRIQSAISSFFSDEELRRNYMPHIKGLYISTHSHLFLDRRNITNNHIVSKSDRSIYIEQIQSPNDFHHLQFSLLGNDIESLFMPSAIVIVEGKTDQMFFRKLLSIKFPNRRITIVLGDSDGELSKKLHTLREAFGDISRSPYHSRLFLVIDATNTTKRTRLNGFGVRDENIIVWKKNGIEHYYPRSLMKEIFCCDDHALDSIDVSSDSICINGTRKSKTELAKLICDGLTTEVIMHEEVTAFLDQLRTATKL